MNPPHASAAINVLALPYGVTCRNQLGWKDTLATPQSTERQWEYACGRGWVRTPQVHVDGQGDIVHAPIRLGDWNGTVANNALAARCEGLRAGILARDGKGGAILCAAKA